MSPLSLLTLPQKLLAGAMGIALLAAVSFNIAQAVENRHLAKVNLHLDQRINDPRTGYVVRLTQAEANTATVTAALGRQNEALRTKSAQDAAVIAGVQARFDVEHAKRLSAERQVGVLLAHTPQGATLNDRVLDVDKQILGDLP